MSEEFDYSYFDQSGNKDGYGGYNEKVIEGGWDTYRDLAKHILVLVSPSRVETAFDMGAAKGYLVNALIEQGVKDVKGFDISQYAVDNSLGMVSQYDIRHVDVWPHGHADLIVCIGVLAYVPPQEVIGILKSLATLCFYLYFYATTTEDLAMMESQGFTDSRVKTRWSKDKWGDALEIAGFKFHAGNMWTSRWSGL